VEVVGIGSIAVEDKDPGLRSASPHLLGMTALRVALVLLVGVEIGFEAFIAGFVESHRRFGSA